MEAFLRYNAGRARAGIALSRAGISVSPSPTDLRPVRFFRRVGPSARSSLSTNPRRDLGLEEYYPRFMAQGLDDVEEARTSRTLDSVLETVGMDCNPGYGRPEISRLGASHTSLFAGGTFFLCRLPSETLWTSTSPRAPTTERVATLTTRFTIMVPLTDLTLNEP